jgi:hypothetical protein
MLVNINNMSGKRLPAIPLHDWLPDVRIAVKNVQTMARAYQQICAGEADPWIALGNFRNAWYG